MSRVSQEKVQVKKPKPTKFQKLLDKRKGKKRLFTLLAIFQRPRV